jgi:cytidylate kinase
VGEPGREIAVAIDGPMGSGKSTIAREVARRLGYRHVDTGAMYRAVAAAALRRGVSTDDAEALTDLAGRVRVELAEGADGVRAFVGAEDVTPGLRTVLVNRVVGRVARVPGVRAALRDTQRALGAAGGVVMEGRDIGTVILPDAAVKVFLTASPEERARRRQAELAAAGQEVPLDEVRRIEAEDDEAAMKRDVAPLIVAPDAAVIDSTELGVDDVVARVLALVDRARGL